MFRTVPLSVIISFSLYTQQWYMSYRFADSLLARGTVRNMQSFYSKNKFEKLVHLVDFIIGIVHDARSPERQNLTYLKLHICLSQEKYCQMYTVACILQTYQ